MITGRNDPCPCGSGKKYKRCCGLAGKADISRPSTVSPKNMAVSLETGYGYLNAGQLQKAGHICRQILSVLPRSAGAAQLEGLIAQRSGDLTAAVRWLRKAVVFDPGSPVFVCNLGSFLAMSGEEEEAVRCFNKALALDPAYVRASNNLGNVEKDRGNLLRAKDLFEQTVQTQPNYPEAWISLGNLHREMGQFDQAMACYQRALHFRPAYPDARFNIAQMKLLQGDLESAWADFDERFAMQHCAVPKRVFPYPLFRGEPIPADQKLLVWGEQGVGDEILFATLLGDLTDNGVPVVLECETRLVALFQRSFSQIEVVARTEPARDRLQQGDIARQIPAGSLARLYRPLLASFPHRIACLQPDPLKLSHWKNWLASLGPGLKIGISWRSGLRLGARNWYYTELSQWGPILKVPGVIFVNLQYGDCRKELDQACRRFNVEIHEAPELNLKDDLDEAAALTRALDLVIAPNTSVFAMAGAVGAPTWLLDLDCDWTMLGTDHVPWFPSVEVLRKSWEAPWESVLTDVARRLAQHAEEHIS